jgi:hypothetical protein
LQFGGYVLGDRRSFGGQDRCAWDGKEGFVFGYVLSRDCEVVLVLSLSSTIGTVNRTNTSSSTLVPHIDQIDLV